MSINSNHHGYNLTHLPTTLWSTAASFLDLKEMGRLSLTHRVFIESLTKLTERQKKFLKDCKISPYSYRDFSIMANERSPSLSLPVLLQLVSLQSLRSDMLRKYMQTIANCHGSGKEIFLKCKSLMKFDLEYSSNPYYLEGLQFCQNLNNVHFLCTYLNKNQFNNFLEKKGDNLKNILITWGSTLGNATLDSIILHCSNLRSLTIPNHFFVNVSAIASLTHLTWLSIDGLCENLNLEDIIPLITSRPMIHLNIISNLPLTQKYIDALENNSSQLEHLSLYQDCVGNGLVHPLSFSRLFSRLNNITCLNVSSCNITDADLKILHSHANQLQILNVSYNPGITLKTLKKFKKTNPKISIDSNFGSLV